MGIPPPPHALPRLEGLVTNHESRITPGLGVALVWPWCSLGVALGWPWGGLGVALGWPWCSLGVALGWLWGGFGVPMRCLSTGLGVALGGPWGGLGVALGWPWCSLGVALGWLWGGFGVPMRCLSTGLGVALGWPWGGFGWLRATSFLVSAFSISAFQLLPKCGFGVACLPSHESRITNHLRLWVAPPGCSRFEVRGSKFRSQDQTGLNAETQRNAEKRRENEVSADLVGTVVPNERAVLENALTD
jgi:hypothetical protein